MVRRFILSALALTALFSTACNSECTSQNDCALGSVCCRGECVSALAECVQCEVDNDCATGEECKMNVCLPIVVRRDGGPPPNQAPTAVIMGPTQVDIGEAARLDGAGSFDPEGDPLSYAWRIVTQPATSTSTIENPTTNVGRFQITHQGRYEVELVVSDGELMSNPVTWEVSGEIPNDAPIADAGIDQMADVGATVILDGSNSTDPDGDPLTYQWTIVSAPGASTATITSDTSSVARFTPDIDGQFEIELTVDDGRESSRPDTMLLDVQYVTNGIGTLDPSQIYVLGRALPLNSTSYVVANHRTATLVGGAFPDHHDQLRAFIHPTTNRLIYQWDGALYEWTPEPIRFFGDGTWEFPPNPELNDIPVPLPADCPGVVLYLINPETGRYAMQCGSGWIHDDGRRFTECAGTGGPLFLGFGNRAICGSEMFFDGIQIVPITPPIGLPILATYAYGDGSFRLVTGTPIPNPVHTHWEIGPDGMSRVLGTYANHQYPVPANFPPNAYTTTLDRDGNFYRILNVGPTIQDDALIKFEPDYVTTSAVWFENDSYVKWASSVVVSGR